VQAKALRDDDASRHGDRETIDGAQALPLYRTPPLRDVWYMVMAGRRLAKGTMTSTTLLGERLLIGRDAVGSPFALRDLCPHRGIPLSCGRFDGREIECRYHGWRFDAGGQCTAIPSLPSDAAFEPSRVRVKSYPVREVEGSIWVFYGDDPEGAPEIPLAASHGERLYRLNETVRFHADINNAVISLIDPGHGPYVHNSRIWHVRGTGVDKEKSYIPSPFGFTMERHATSANYRAYRAVSGRRETEIVFQLPGVRIERTWIGRHLVVNMTAMTPLSEGEVEMHHTVHFTMGWLNLLRPLARPIVRRFIRQDAKVMEQQQIGLRDNPPILYVGDADLLIRWYYRLRQEYSAARREQRPFVNPLKPRVLRYRT
jgi:phenylpropionate dioxygenase-like ring-hydroxylating dioxygenase large terminal subunit